jgi:hypothetical protein
LKKRLKRKNKKGYTMSVEYRNTHGDYEAILLNYKAEFKSTIKIMIYTLIFIFFQRIIDPGASGIGMLINGFIITWGFSSAENINIYSLFKNKNGEHLIKNLVGNEERFIPLNPKYIKEIPQETINSFHEAMIIGFLMFLNFSTILIVAIARIEGLI